MFGHQAPQTTDHTGRGVVEARVGGGKGKALHGKRLEPAPGRPLPRQRFVAGLGVVLGLPAQALQQVGNGDAHRAHLAAGTAQARGGHQIARALQPQQVGEMILPMGPG